MGSSSNRYAPRLPQQETKSSTKLLAPTDPILGPENLLKTSFAQKGLPSTIFVVISLVVLVLVLLLVVVVAAASAIYLLFYIYIYIDIYMYVDTEFFADRILASSCKCVSVKRSKMNHL